MPKNLNIFFAIPKFEVMNLLRMSCVSIKAPYSFGAPNFAMSEYIITPLVISLLPWGQDIKYRRIHTTQTFQQTNKPTKKQTNTHLQKRTNKQTNKQTNKTKRNKTKRNKTKQNKQTTKQSKTHIPYDTPIELPLCSPTNSPVKVDRPAQGIPAMKSWLSVGLRDFISLLHNNKGQERQVCTVYIHACGKVQDTMEELIERSTCQAVPAWCLCAAIQYLSVEMGWCCVCVQYLDRLR